MLRYTIFTAYNEAKRKLKEAGIETYGFEARQIIRHITGYTNAEIMAKYNEQLTPYQMTIYTFVVDKRCTRYPLQYLLGEWSFYGLDFYVGEGVLIPRPDTETLVDKALEFLKGKDSPQVLDLCSGSGCIAIAIAKNSNSEVDALEKYDDPAAYLKKNIDRHGVNVNLIKADIYDFKVTKEYDLIVSNPPYIAADDMENIDAETGFEPDTALYGGEDGLMFYRLIAEKYTKHIKNGGMLAVEVGYTQSGDVAEIFKAAGLYDIGTAKDIDGNERVVFGTVNNV